MGIRHLNKFLQKHASQGIQKKLLFSLKNKKIAIDANNYLYKFLCNGDLIPNLYEFCLLLNYYNIEPVFVFDGEPPPEKMSLIEKRREERKTAKEKYEALLTLVKENNTKYSEKELKDLKRKSIYLSTQNTKESKQLMDYMNYQVIIAPGEADVYCCHMVNTDQVYACMSEDMDMFVYGCKRVIRYVSILNNTCIMYNFENILNELNMNHEEFKIMCILSGTDYNKTTRNIYLNYTLFSEYKKSNSTLSFKDWIQTIDYISNLNINNIIKLFELKNITGFYFTKIKANKDITLQQFLENYNFIFPQAG